MFSQQRRSTAAAGVPHSLLPPPFRCTSSRGRLRGARVEASGELDLLTSPEFERALREAAVVSPRLVVLDLHALTFIDSTGVHAIEDARSQALLHGGRLVLSRVPAHVARILALTGTMSTVVPLEVSEMPNHLRLVGQRTLEA